MYVRVNNDLIYLDKLIKAEFTPASYNSSTIKLTYMVEGLNTKDPCIVSVFSDISKNSIQLLVEALQNDKDYVDISRKPLTNQTNSDKITP